jgi:hypothetical protein
LKKSPLVLALLASASLAYGQATDTPGSLPTTNTIPLADLSYIGAQTFPCNSTLALGPILACPLSLVQPPFQAPSMFGATNGVPSTPGQVQASVAIPTIISGLTGVTTPGDSNELPTAAGGGFQAVCNLTANYSTLYPFSGDAINSGGSNVPINLDGHSCGILFGITLNKWGMLALPYGANGDVTYFGSDGRPIDSGVLLSSLTTASNTQTLTNKSIAGSEVNSGTIPAAQLPAATASAAGAITAPTSGPASVTIGQSGVAQTVPSDTTEDVLATVTVPAGSLGATGCLTIWTAWEFTGSTNSKTFRVRFNGSGGASGSAFLSQNTAVAGNTSAFYWTVMCNRTSSSQIGGPAGGALGAGNSTPQTAAVNTSNATFLVITGQKALNTETLILDDYRITE